MRDIFEDPEGKGPAGDPPIFDRIGRDHDASAAHRRWAKRNYCGECAREWADRTGQ